MATLSIDNLRIDESARTAVFRLVLNEAASTAVTVDYEAHGDSAERNLDFSATSGRLTIPAGETEAQVQVQLLNDSTVEGWEAFELQLFNISGAALTNDRGRAEIAPSDAPAMALPLISGRSTVVNENSRRAQVEISLNAPSTSTVSVAYSVVSAGSSLSAADIVAPADGRLSFAPGQTFQTLSVPLVNDTLNEAAESFVVKLSGAVGAVISNFSVPVTVLGPNGLNGTPQVSISNLWLDEGQQAAVFLITLDRAPSSPLELRFITRNGSAQADHDYVYTDRSVTLLPGQRVAEVLVPLLRDSDSAAGSEPEGDESFYLVQVDDDGAPLPASGGVAWLADIDAAPVANPYITTRHSLVADSEGRAELSIRLSAPSNQRVSVTYADVAATAAAADTIGPFAGTLVLEAGQVLASLVLPLNPGVPAGGGGPSNPGNLPAAAEGAEALLLQLSNPVNAALGDSRALLTITAHSAAADSSGARRMLVSDLLLDEGAGLVGFAITLTGAALTEPLRIPYSFVDAPARLDQDFYEALGDDEAERVIVFSPGGPSVQWVWVEIEDDKDEEDVEAFRLQLQLPQATATAAAVLGDESGEALIIDNDFDASTQARVSVWSAVARESDAYASTWFSLDRPLAMPVLITYRDQAVGVGSASSASDYGGSVGSGNTASVLIEPGRMLAEVRWPLLRSAGAEPMESFQVDIVSASNATVANSRGLVSIAPHGLAPGAAAPSAANTYVGTSNLRLQEGGALGSFYVQLNQAPGQELRVRYELVSLSANLGEDFRSSGSGELVFGADDTVQAVRVWSPQGVGNEVEGGEVFELRLTGAPGATVINAIGQGYIAPGRVPLLPEITAAVDVANAAAGGKPAIEPSIELRSVLSVASEWVDEAAGFVEVYFTLNEPSIGVVVVNYRSLVGTADAADFGEVAAGQLAFAPGQVLQSVRLALVDDAMSEGAEACQIEVVAVTGARIGNSLATVVVAASDHGGVGGGAGGAGAGGGAVAATAELLPLLHISSPVVDESAGLARFLLWLDRPSSQPVQFDFSTRAGSASPATTDGAGDYLPRQGQAGFMPGQTVMTLEVALVNDEQAENDESFSLDLFKVRGAVAAQAAGLARLPANDGFLGGDISLQVRPAQAYEDDGFVDVVVRLSGASLSPVSVNLSTSAGTAGAGDFISLNAASLVFAAGETSKTVRIALVDDSVAEAAESFSVMLSGAEGALVDNTPALVTVIDTDAAVTATFSSGAGGSTSSVARGPVSYTLSFSTAVSGLVLGDFHAVNGSVSAVTALDGSGARYSVTLTPAVNAQGVMSLALPRGSVISTEPVGGITAVVNRGVALVQAVDMVAPTLLGSTPANGAEVAANTTFTLRFSEAMARGNGALDLRTAAGQLVQTFDLAVDSTSWSFNAAGDSLTLRPASALTVNTTYSLSSAAGSGLTDLAGNALPALPLLQVLVVGNAPPVANNIEATVLEDTVFNGNLPPASDPEGGAVSYRVANPAPGKGQVLVNEDGSYRYTPNLNANGSDSFGFSVRDAGGAQSSYTVSLTITALNDAPQGAVSISGNAAVFERLTGHAALSDADGLGSFSYQWRRSPGGSGSALAIPGATQASYDTTLDDAGSTLSLRVSYTDGGGTSETVASAATALVTGLLLANGTAGADTLTGTAGNDALNGGAGNDRLSGLAGRDDLAGGDGDDVLDGGAGDDTLQGGLGVDVASFPGSTAVNASLAAGLARRSAAPAGGQPVPDEVDVLINIEALFGSSAADTLRGFDGLDNRRGETLRGAAGNDTLDGGSGVDTAEYTGARAGYSVLRSVGAGGSIPLTVEDTQSASGNDGRDSLLHIERLLFADQLLAFGTRAEEVARVAIVLWNKDIVSSPSLFARGLSYYDVGYSFDELSLAALQFWPQQGREFAQLLLNNSGSSQGVDVLLALMTSAGGGDAGRAAAVRAVAMDGATTTLLSTTGVLSNGLVADLSLPGFGTLFALLPG